VVLAKRGVISNFSGICNEAVKRVIGVVGCVHSYTLKQFCTLVAVRITGPRKDVKEENANNELPQNARTPLV
jgi:hypothetical protein